MVVGVWAAWAACYALTFATTGAYMVSISTPETPYTYISHLEKPLLLGQRRSRSSSSSVGASGSSNSPVQPIEPLLDLTPSDAEASSKPPVPKFDRAAPTNVSGLTGTAAYLHCLVHNLGNKSVSWIRQRDLHIMTVGRYTYTTDQRYQVIHSPGSKDWILKIKYAQVRDSGNYECQVSTKPITSYVVRLNVFAAPRATIIGAPDMHVDMGSTINLTCTISHTPEPPDFIYWYHNGEVVSYDSPRGGITVVTERGNTTSGYLLIQDAKASDSGNYSCVPSNTAATSLRVHVLNGETPAAMQTNGGVSMLTAPIALPYFPGLLQVLLVGLILMQVMWDQHSPGPLRDT
ncbi:zwei Ig domain protein zig-8-like [Panulirus ornatus]|uniref:zwei Ig domain protein zig-8-like n=1 Tax=Panulirus ornatus TaxID=150431 RepID=UPI003A8A48D9